MGVKRMQSWKWVKRHPHRDKKAAFGRFRPWLFLYAAYKINGPRIEPWGTNLRARTFSLDRLGSVSGVIGKHLGADLISGSLFPLICCIIRAKCCFTKFSTGSGLLQPTWGCGLKSPAWFIFLQHVSDAFRIYNSQGFMLYNLSCRFSGSQRRDFTDVLCCPRFG